MLRQAGLRTDVLPADRVSDLPPYNAVVLGSAVYIGRWRKEAARFLKANEKVLAEQLVWLFSSGPTGKGDPVELTQDWRLPGKLQPIADRIAPHDIAVFHGAVDMGKMNFIEKWMLKNVKVGHRWSVWESRPGASAPPLAAPRTSVGRYSKPICFSKVESYV